MYNDLPHLSLKLESKHKHPSLRTLRNLKPPGVVEMNYTMLMTSKQNDKRKLMVFS